MGTTRREVHGCEEEVGGMGGGAAASERLEGEVGAAERPTRRSNCGCVFLTPGGLEIWRLRRELVIK
jgi:hypothetical protein